MFKKVMKQRQRNIKVMLWTALVCAAIGVVLQFFILRLDPEKGLFESMTLMVATGYVLVTLIFGSSQFPQQYNVAVAMGAVRKKYMAAYFAVSLLLHVEMYVLIVCVWLIETGIHRLLPADIVKTDIARSVLFSPYFIAGIVLLVAVEMLVGTTIMRFGKKAGAFWWVLWMTACIVPDHIEDYVQSHPSAVPVKAGTQLIQALTGMGTAGIWMCMTVFALLAAAVIWRIGCRQQVTQF